MDNNIKKAKIQQLVFDNKNMNKGTQFGGSLLEKSLSKFGAGRSILVDKNNRIIAGNKTIENAGTIGLEDVIIVETTGNQIVAVKRTDVDLDTPTGRELALADNATSKANLDWDYDNLEELAEDFNIVPNDWGVDLELDIPEELVDKPTEEESVLIITSKDESRLSLLMDELQDRGFDVKFK